MAAAAVVAAKASDKAGQMQAEGQNQNMPVEGILKQGVLGRAQER